MKKKKGRGAREKNKGRKDHENPKKMVICYRGRKGAEGRKPAETCNSNDEDEL
jgi:hypothetical protein